MDASLLYLREERGPDVVDLMTTLLCSHKKFGDAANRVQGSVGGADLLLVAADDEDRICW